MNIFLCFPFASLFSKNYDLQGHHPASMNPSVYKIIGIS